MTIIFDTETTGKADFNQPPEHECQPRLVQLGALLLDWNLLPVGELNLIIKPDGFEIPVEASEIHGITTQLALSYGVPEQLALNLFADWLAKAKTLVAHNIAFDGIIMGRAFHLHGMKPAVPTPYCTMKSAMNVCKLPGRSGQYKWPTLTEAHQILLGVGFEGAHDAMADVRACARIYERLIHGDRPLARPAEPVSTKPSLDTNHPDAAYDDDTLMPFGKWRGTPLGQLSDDYCNWLYEQGEALSDRRLYTWLHGKP